MKKGRFVLSVIVPLLVIAMVITIFLLHKGDYISSEEESPVAVIKEQETIIEDKSIVKVFFPVGLSLQMSEVEVKKIYDAKKSVERALSELFEHKNIIDTGVIPKETSLIGVYSGIDNIIYINISKEVQSNFQGDIMDEFLLLKSIYETTVANIEADDVKILVDSREVETVGGHFDIRFPLKSIVTEDIGF